jgi:hypothetical protein
MTVRALLTALLLGGAVVGSRLLAGPLAAPPQDASATVPQIAPVQGDQTEAGAKHHPTQDLTGTQLPIHQSVDAASADAVSPLRYSS